ncbi:sensor histidine kinase [Pseudoalteromonas sp. MEBiC 03607]|jgi:Na+/proline symporter/signal transduction histidine kinase/CheY-like chemotaxis protein|uniref:PAS domain-containing hybrid sensor histidine kinase/response regulator n=1 Tax=Pseudoalteromonas TaxID=53246 RepID=UPI000C50485B|nr:MULTISPECIES: PAS-domain containing protein [unclassified Pseudoalteromonas]MBU77518.1 hybrid sensor histidine kinase/response regulator [Pseudoalteromonadaceae bacterium]MCF2919153.1 PAS-domain containing protein [Pseudoalteromonas sp. APAL1]TGV21443.1 sensor histidine kinase [Pseudoalteromonas sp. MEBiC 03607]HCV05177.1 hybrid sensor histidine kinase/response regulator [Pseudoalteromonas sp.]|tara:strand:- start:65 stop:3505 length:3441 start_codon:yes stop_codon:yes gene_type:complete
MTAALLFVALAYIGVLFWLANWGDKTTPLAKRISHHPFVYSFSLGIYCTSWTYYGSVGTAATNSWNYLPILIGPALLFFFGQGFLRKLVLVSKKQNITTIADFISARYGKRQTTAIMVTIIALLATIPYIALQLKALSGSFLLLQNDSRISGSMLALSATLIMAMFAIFFGTRKVDVTEYRSGLMLAVAFESMVKLLALVAVAGLALYTLFNLSEVQAEQLTGSVWQHWHNFDFFSFNFIGQSMMAAAAIICLPRQFHVTVVDNQDKRHLFTARWAFPLYLLLTAAMIFPIATAAIHPGIGSGFSPDSFVLALPLIHENAFLTTFVFIGGLSAATAMIVVATLTLSTMISNDVVLPLMLRRKFKRNLITSSYKSQILLVRRFTIAGILILSYFYQQWFGHGKALASMGLVAFSLVSQLLPAIVGGLYWRKGHAYGVYAGLLAGFICWVLFLMLPILDAGNSLNTELQQTLITRGTLIALFANIGCYISFSLGADERLIDKIQAAAFVNPKEQAVFARRLNKNVKATVYDFKVLLQTFLGVQRSQQVLAHFALSHNLDDNNAHPDPEFIAYCERALTGVLGASSAQALIHTVASGKRMAFEEVVNFFDETTQALQFNQNLLFTSLENLSHGISVVDKELNLVAWNKRYAEMFNYPDEFLEVGQPIEEVIRYNAERGECGPGEVERHVEKRVQHLKNGTPHHFIRHRRNGQVFEMIGNPLPDGGFVTSFSDITVHIETQNALEEVNMDLENRIEARTQEIRTINRDLQAQIDSRVQTEQALTLAKKEAEQANDSKTRFLALASHDILQPLNAARLYLAAIDDKTLSSNNLNNFEKLGASLDSTVHLMSALLEIAKLEQGAMTPTPRHFSIDDILAPLKNEYAIMSSEKGLKLTVRSKGTIVHSDITYLRRIIQNLVSNAVKYTESGRVLIACRKRKHHLRIEVWDTGPGISEVEQAKIFNDFYRIEAGDNKGVGLGLGVVKRMVDLLSLRMDVTSTPGKGSRFSIEVPYGESQFIQQKDTPKKGVENRSAMNIIAVDDDPENLNAMASLLQKWQANYQLFDQVETVMAYAKDHGAPDVILMDYQLGHDCDGITLIKTLREIWQSPVPAILITAVRDEALKQQTKAEQIHYLSKPVKPAKLKALLNHST